jgi:hypothetical protein
MFLEALVIGSIIGFIKGGRMLSIGAIYFRGTFYLIAGLILQTFPLLLGYFNLFSGAYAFFSFLGVLLIMAFFLRNIQRRGVWLILLGGALNIIAMLFSGLAMPVDLNALAYSGLSSMADTIRDGSIVNMVDVANSPGIIKVLSKFIALPAIYPLAKVISVGDILISIGLAWLVSYELTTKRHLSSLGRGRYRSSYF